MFHCKLKVFPLCRCILPKRMCVCASRGTVEEVVSPTASRRPRNKSTWTTLSGIAHSWVAIAGLNEMEKMARKAVCKVQLSKHGLWIWFSVFLNACIVSNLDIYIYIDLFSFCVQTLSLYVCVTLIALSSQIKWVDKFSWGIWNNTNIKTTTTTKNKNKKKFQRKKVTHKNFLQRLNETAGNCHNHK